jgi:hypothetical protein
VYYGSNGTDSLSQNIQDLMPDDVSEVSQRIYGYIAIWGGEDRDYTHQALACLGDQFIHKDSTNLPEDVITKQEIPFFWGSDAYCPQP